MNVLCRLYAECQLVRPIWIEPSDSTDEGLQWHIKKLGRMTVDISCNVFRRMQRGKIGSGNLGDLAFTSTACTNFVHMLEKTGM